MQRFLRYVQIDTTAQADAEDYPSSPGQLELGRLLVDELQALGIADARQNQHGIVLATIPATAEKGQSPFGTPSAVPQMGTVPFSAPTIALCSHLDTSPETTGAGVQAAGDRKLSRRRHRAARRSQPGDPRGRQPRTGVAPRPHADHQRRHDSAWAPTTRRAWPSSWKPPPGSSSIPEIAHGPVRICFTCDEEIGRGVDKLDLHEIGAAACYTLDGHGSGEIDVETFSADQAVVTIRGVNIHPSIAKGRMTNAVRAAADFIARLPRDCLSPETTEGREGFLHPYEIQGGVAEVKLKILLRDFEAAKLAELADRLRQTAAAVNREFPAAKIDVRHRPAVSQHGRGTCAGAARRGLCPAGPANGWAARPS